MMSTFFFQHSSSIGQNHLSQQPGHLSRADTTPAFLADHLPVGDLNFWVVGDGQLNVLAYVRLPIEHVAQPTPWLMCISIAYVYTTL